MKNKCIAMLLFIASTIATAQVKNLQIYAVDSYLNRNCPGGTGFCPGTVIKEAKDKSTTLLAKTSENKIRITLAKSGFSILEWNEFQVAKVFKIEKGLNISMDQELLSHLQLPRRLNRVVEKNYPVTFELEKAVFEIELE